MKHRYPHFVDLICQCDCSACVMIGTPTCMCPGCHCRTADHRRPDDNEEG